MRLWVMLAGTALVVAACGTATVAGDPPGDIGDSAVSTDSSTPSNAEPETGIFPDGPSALVDRFDESFPEPLIDPRDILSGGPPPDGIPPIDDPKFVTVAKADDWLNDPEPVMEIGRAHV